MPNHNYIIRFFMGNGKLFHCSRLNVIGFDDPRINEEINRAFYWWSAGTIEKATVSLVYERGETIMKTVSCKDYENQIML